MYIIFLIHLLASVIYTDSSYQIPSYYGYWNLNFFHYQNLTKGQLKYFQLHESIDMDPDGNIYIADKQRHTIYKTTQDGYILLAGSIDRSGQRPGLAKNSLWNGPTSVAYFSPDKEQAKIQNTMNLIFVQNQSCSIQDADCLIPNPSKVNLKLSNIAFNPSLNQFPQINQKQQYLYVSDTNNHCIKLIDLVENIVRIIAGKCGQSGFRDGPFQVNRLNNPKNIGVTRNNEVYFFDSGNLYMRKLYNGSIYTMYNGGCLDYGTSRTIRNSYNIHNILCYNNWVQGKTNNPISHYVDPQNNVDMCTDIYPHCLIT